MVRQTCTVCSSVTIDITQAEDRPKVPALFATRRDELFR